MSKKRNEWINVGVFYFLLFLIIILNETGITSFEAYEIIILLMLLIVWLLLLPILLSLKESEESILLVEELLEKYGLRTALLEKKEMKEEINE